MTDSYLHAQEFPWPSDPSHYGVRVNHLPVDALFERYRDAGFLYPKKLDRLAPYWTQIESNWKKMLGAAPNPLLHEVLMSGAAATGSWSTGAIWLTRPGTVQAHHLASNRDPLASRRVFLAGQARAWAAGARYAETWYRTENRFPNRFFGGCATFLGRARAQTDDISLVGVPKTMLVPGCGSIVVGTCSIEDVPVVTGFLIKQWGRFMTAAEQLDPSDLSMRSVDEVYRSIGLRRYRNVYIARDRTSNAIMGVALAYRGPLGTNLSFAENVCRLVVAGEVMATHGSRILLALARAALATYETFELPFMVVGCDAAGSRAFVENGATPMQTYRRLVWNRAGFADWYRYVDEVYERISTRSRDCIAVEA